MALRTTKPQTLYKAAKKKIFPTTYMIIIVQQDATIYTLFISVNRSTFFGWYLHPSSGAHVTVNDEDSGQQHLTRIGVPLENKF